MASRCYRSVSKPTMNLIFKSTISSSPKPSFTSKPIPSISTRFSSRSVSQLGCVQSLLPLHSAIASALLTSRLSAEGLRSLALGMISGANPGV